MTSRDWVDDVIAGWRTDDEPRYCEQFGCNQDATTWCPLCRAYLCAEHDQLTPVRRHDCLRGRAEVA